MVGNPALDSQIDMSYYFPFMVDHVLVDGQLYEQALRVCGGKLFPPSSQRCQNLIDEMTQGVPRSDKTFLIVQSWAR